MQQITLDLDNDEDARPSPVMEPERQQQLINEINAALKAIFTKPEYLRTIPTEKRVKIQRIIDNAAQRKDVSKSLDGKRGLSPGPVLQDPKAQ